MPEEIRISVFETVGSSLCVATSDGQKVYEHIATALKADRDVALSFYNVTALTATFLNTAIGQLYGTFTEEKIRSRVNVKDLEQDHLALLKRVVDNTKWLFRVKCGNELSYRNAAMTRIRKCSKLRNPKARRLMSLILLLIPSTMPLVVRWQK